MDLESRPNRLPWPPMIYAGAIVVAALLQQITPIRNLDALLGAVPGWAAVAVLVLGAAIDLAAIATLWRHGTTVLPNAGSRALCTTGVYAFSRNPIYLGNAIAMAGVALTLRWSWLLLLVPVTAAAVTWLAIEREEEHLALRFGYAFKVYCERVRRWL
jgi:protein-S-isoprenylcysteine O-methyltransferase Ste14